MSDAKAFNDLFKSVADDPAGTAERILALEADAITASDNLAWSEQRIRELEAEVSVGRHNLAISEHQRRELEAEVARLTAYIQQLQDQLADEVVRAALREEER